MERLNVNKLLELAISKNATDLHLVANQPPILRIDGELTPALLPTLKPEDLLEIIMSMLTDKQKETFQQNQELDFSYLALNDFYFRVNIHKEKGNLAATIRIMSRNIKTPFELGLPSVVEDLVKKRKGLIIISGSAGCGKTTTLTSLVDLVNRKRKCKIITIEDPIEFVHDSKQSLIIQREVGSDTLSFANALKYALRQDPDVVVVGEMRDPESISMVLTTAETGHLVITTLHSTNAIESINRIIDVYPTGKQEQIRFQLSEALTAIISQALVSKRDGIGRVLACEVLVATLSVRNMIRRNALQEIRGQMETGGDFGMQTIEQSLSKLVQQDLITKSSAIEHSRYPNLLKC